MTENRLRELQAFCRQYSEKLGKIKEKHSRTERYKRDIRMIEQTARETNEEIAVYIIKSVTKGMSYEQIECSIVNRTKFYELRREFFRKLDRNQA